MKKSNIFIGMIIINAISMILGFLRDSSIAYRLGASSSSDAFIFTINLPTILFSAIGWVISSTFVPMYTDIRVNSSLDEANKFANNFIKLIVFIAAILYAIMAIFNKTLIKILAPGFKGETLYLVQDLIIVILPSLIFFAITYCFAGILTSHKKMVWISLIGIPVNLFVILGIIVVAPKYGLQSAVFISLIGTIVQFIILLPPLISTGFKLNFKFNLKDKQMRKVLKLIGPMMIGVMAQQINSLFSGMVASTLNTGSITSYNLATKVIYAAYNSFIMIAISFMFPYLSENIANNEITEFNRSIRNGLKLLVIILFPMIVFLVFFDKEVIKILYGYGNFKGEAVNVTAKILNISSFSIIFLAIRDLINRAFYAYKDTATPMKNSIVSIIINIILSILLAKKFDVSGLALANTISMVIVSILLIMDLNKKTALFTEKATYIKYGLKIFISSVLLYSFLLIIKNFLGSSLSLVPYVLVLGILGTIFYLISLHLFGVNIKKQI